MPSSLAPSLAPQKMTIRDLARRWAPEISVDWRDLENALCQASIDGDFNSLPGGEGLLVCDHETGQNWSTSGAKIRSEFAGSGNATVLLRMFKDNEGLAVHRSAVLLFANARKLTPPSWWAPANVAPAERPNVPRRALEEFLRQTADGVLAEADLLSEAEQHFAQNSIPRAMWRSVFAELPAAQKRPRGAPKSRRPA